MNTDMDPEEVRAWAARWEMVNEAEIEELRQTPVSVKLRQLAAMMASAELFGEDPNREAEVEEVRQRWKKIRDYYAKQADAEHAGKDISQPEKAD